ncbi:hypothetical protein ACFXTO_035842 [Malus domestica]
MEMEMKSDISVDESKTFNPKPGSVIPARRRWIPMKISKAFFWKCCTGRFVFVLATLCFVLANPYKFRLLHQNKLES